MNMRHNKFTLVELLVVICIASLLMGVVLPAFNRMVTGSAVDRLASNLKLRLERAQSHAASSRRHVAILLPNGTVSSSWSSETRVKNAALGGSRLCYVDNVKTEGAAGSEEYVAEFKRWIADEDWVAPERGALLVAISASDPVDANGNLTLGSSEIIQHDKELTQNILKGIGKNKPLKKIENIKFIEGNPAKTTVSDSAIIFAPKGGIRSTADVYFVIAEAMVEGDKVFYPGGQCHNFRVLKINRLTGKVEYHR